jgi:hypothetical protein
VYNYNKDQRKPENYNNVLQFYIPHSKRDCRNTIKTFELIDDEQPPGAATSARTGDMATWLSRSWRDCTDAGEDLPVKKEEAHATAAGGGSGVSPLTTYSDGKITRPLGIHRREQKLQELPKLKPRFVLH